MKGIIGGSSTTVEIYSTQEKIVFHSTLGDVTSELASVSTNKDLLSPSGSFSLNLVMREDANKRTWFDKVHPYDFVVIKFKGILDEKEKVVMRGLVDIVTKSETFEGGIPSRAIIVSGRDLGCLFTDLSIYYMPELGQKQAIESELKVLAWKVNVEMIGNVKDIFKFLMEHFIQSININVGTEGAKIPLITYLDHEEEALFPTHKTNLFFLMSYEGAWWNAFTEYQDKPFHELFIYDDDDKAYLIMRPANLKDANRKLTKVVEDLRKSNYILYPNPQNWTISSEEKISSTISRNMNETFNFYLTIPTLSLFSKEEFRAMCWAGNLDNPRASINPYVQLDKDLPSYLDKYGFRKYEAGTVFMDLDFGQKDSRNKEYVQKVLFPNFVEKGQEMNKILVGWYLHNPLLLSGSIDIPGTNRAMIGSYVTDNDEAYYDESSPTKKSYGIEYYVEGVSHSFQVLTSFRTGLRVTRGIPLKGLGLYSKVEDLFVSPTSSIYERRG